MATDFFERQHAARRNTGWLVFLFLLAVLGIIALVYAVLAVAVGAAGEELYGRVGRPRPLVDLDLLVPVVLCTLLVVLSGTLYKIAQLRSGGLAVAEGLGGRRIRPDTVDPDERKLLNVVEEMAIASGTPTPPVYLLAEESGINAFAAGHSPHDAVVGVTRGTIERLSRDELQGVIAHEFSHILNGDMRLNIRLIGVLYGILVIGMIGYFILRSVARSGRVRSSSRRGRGNPLPLLALGLGLMIVGYVGTFFGSLIKAAVSRQREFLADAASVQFTRNPDGIAGALKKIGGLIFGSRVLSPNAPEASHMFFGEAVARGLTSLFSTHPPLAERIRRIDPSWDGTFPKVHAARAAEVPALTPTAAALAGPQVLGSAVDHIGQPTEAHIRYAVELVQSLPAPIAVAAHEPYGARAVIYALLINKEPQSRRVQLEALARCADAGVLAETRRLLPMVERLDAKLTLPLIDMAIPALRTLSRAQYATFRRHVDELVRSDAKISLLEWVLHRILLRHLAPQFTTVRVPGVQYYALRRLKPQCQMVLSVLAHVGHRDGDQARRSFAQAAKHLGLPPMDMLPREQCGLDALGQALDALALAAPRLKRQILLACATGISADRQITASEAELLRAVADTLDCPMPPLLPGQPVT